MIRAVRVEAGRVKSRWPRLFFGLAACSWVPHWSCHYYRLETGSSFVVGSWVFSRLDSWVTLTAYSALIGLNLAAVVAGRLRCIAAAASGALHVAIGGLHVYRLFVPFRFEIFGYAWSQHASLREAVAVVPFGLACLFVAAYGRAVSSKEA